MTQPLVPAATLILMRDRPGGAPELLMVRRSPALAFAGGAWVFPGGRVDPQDRWPGLDEEGAARVAAIRETIEEAGIAAGLLPEPGAAAVARLQAGLHAGEPLAALLAAAGLALAPDALVPFARWAPPEAIVRRFDTRFFLAPAPAPDRVTLDGTESVDWRWTTAAAMLAEADAGRAALVLPTRANLHRLAPAASFAAAAAAARAVPVRLVTTVREVRDGRPHVCVPDGHGYPPLAFPIG